MLTASSRKGFTLAELMAVIAIMAIITSLLVVAAKGARRKADVDAAKAGVALITSKIDAYKAKRGKLPFDPNPTAALSVTNEAEIYDRLNQWGFSILDKDKKDPWDNPYIIVLQKDYGKSFDLTVTPYDVSPFTLMRDMYMELVSGNLEPLATPAAAAKDIHEGDPAATPAYMREADGYQVISAGPDGKVCRDGSAADANGDNITNW